MRAVPGSTTAVKDSDWVADRLGHGRVQPSCIPPAPIREWRDLTRQRKALVDQRTHEVTRSEQLREGATSTLAAVATSLLGSSACDLLQALLDGAADQAARADLARGRMRAKRAHLQQALTGTLRPFPFQQGMLPQILAHIDVLQASMAQVEAAIDERLRPSAQAVELLPTSSGGNATAAATLVAELGVAMTRLPSAAHLASWAGVCPANQQRGGKRLSAKTRRGDTWLQAVLCEVVWANARSQTCSLGAQLRRLSRRRGIDTALSAVAHSLVVSV
jgi:transposase